MAKLYFTFSSGLMAGATLSTNGGEAIVAVVTAALFFAIAWRL